MIAPSRLALALTGSVCTAVVALAGCSSATPAAGAAYTPVPTAPSASTAAPSASTAATVSSTATASSVASTAPSAAATAPSAGTGKLTATISSVPAAPVLAFGGQPAKFTVTVRNGSGSTYRDITPLVSIGHCSCNTSPASPAPAGTLEELDPSTGSWRPVSYVTEGTGMDFLLASPVQQSPVTLAPGATASFTFRVALDPLADQSPTERAGKTSVDVTLVTVPARTQLGPSPTAYLPVTVTMRSS